MVIFVGPVMSVPFPYVQGRVERTLPYGFSAYKAAPAPIPPQTPVTAKF
jgi:hypothetical protein